MTYLKKCLINPDRVRQIPGAFSWIDRRIMSDGYMERLTQEALLLYFFLVTVSDREGLSFWGERRIKVLLKMKAEALERARGRLIEEGLIAYRPPLYQVLALRLLAKPCWIKTDSVSKGPMRIGDLLNTKED